uniref:Uncharacterized protein n=1 Tax=Schistocephalus solidus TaxID=70667 RepID=A0A0V0J476_SCHSO
MSGSFTGVKTRWDYISDCYQWKNNTAVETASSGVLTLKDQVCMKPPLCAKLDVFEVCKSMGYYGPSWNRDSSCTTGLLLCLLWQLSHWRNTWLGVTPVRKRRNTTSAAAPKHILKVFTRTSHRGKRV